VGKSDSVEGFDTALLESATPVTVAMQNEQYEYLWEPFFEALEYDPGTFDSGGYPDMQTIQEAVGDDTVAFSWTSWRTQYPQSILG